MLITEVRGSVCQMQLLFLRNPVLQRYKKARFLKDVHQQMFISVRVYSHFSCLFNKKGKILKTS